MDIFNTTLTVIRLAIEFLEAYEAFPGDKQEFIASFQYDLWAVGRLKDHFERENLEDINEEPLQSTITFLDNFISVVEDCKRKLQRNGVGGVINRVMYVRRQASLEKTKEQLFRWSLRLHLLPQFRAITAAPVDVPTPPAIRSNDRLQQFNEWTRSTQVARGRDMKANDIGDLKLEIEREMRNDRADGMTKCFTNKERQLILSSRAVSRTFLPGTNNFEKLDSQMGILAAALNCLDPVTGIRLLKVESYFYHAALHQFIFTHTPPYPTKSMRTLEKVIRQRPGMQSHIGLGQRISLAAKLAEAVFFLHAAGFVHKNITSGSVVLLEKYELGVLNTTGADSALDEGFLIGFDLIRGTNARTAKEGTYGQPVEEQERGIWDFSIFQHPHRHQQEDSPRYIRAFDVYSLGVLLLEIGMWEPLERLVIYLDDMNPSTWPEELLRVAHDLVPRTGERYQRVVCWCLGLDGREEVEETDFVTEVLDHLDELSSAIL